MTSHVSPRRTDSGGFAARLRSASSSSHRPVVALDSGDDLMPTPTDLSLTIALLTGLGAAFGGGVAVGFLVRLMRKSRG